ncbi:hypothetical protein LZ32DRAFT_610782 [Colletotrichum eremochloae]|nr:hypothetical protein LZ32DRAFT_610782 [Colletotrichum eremochloae]
MVLGDEAVFTEYLGVSYRKLVGGLFWTNYLLLSLMLVLVLVLVLVMVLLPDGLLRAVPVMYVHDDP